MALGINLYGLKQLKSYGLLELISKYLSRDKATLGFKNKTQAHAEELVAMG
jgi:hypothetical protein